MLKYESDHMPPWGADLFRGVGSLMCAILILFAVSAIGYHPTWMETRGALERFEYKVFGRTCEVNAQYTYSVNGLPYAGTRLKDGYARHTRHPRTRDVEAWRYAITDVNAVPVFYDPSNPARSVLWNRPLFGNAALHWIVVVASACAVPLIWAPRLIPVIRAAVRSLR